MESKTILLRSNDEIPFRCRLCGACCRDVEDRIMLEPLDAYRLARLLKERGVADSIEDVYTRYAHTTLLTERFPIYVLNTSGDDHACVFLQDDRCSVYEARLRVCRVYPLAVDQGQRGRRFAYHQCLDCHSAHFEGGRLQVGKWMYENFAIEDRFFFEAECASIPQLGLLCRDMREEVWRGCLFTLLYYRYYNYELDRPFLEQYQRNHAALVKELARRIGKEH